jgi:hypothetical protein
MVDTESGKPFVRVVTTAFDTIFLFTPTSKTKFPHIQLLSVDIVNFTASNIVDISQSWPMLEDISLIRTATTESTLSYAHLLASRHLKDSHGSLVQRSAQVASAGHIFGISSPTQTRKYSTALCLSTPKYGQNRSSVQEVWAMDIFEKSSCKDLSFRTARLQIGYSLYLCWVLSIAPGRLMPGDTTRRTSPLETFSI